MNLKQLFLVVSLSLSTIAVCGKAASGQTRLGLHVTQEELNIWKQRAASGPYKSAGDVSTNSPGDWTRIKSKADAFLANPGTEWWVGQTTAACRTNSDKQPARTVGERLRDAGFVYLITGNTNYRDAVRNELLAQAAQAGTNFEDSTRWCVDTISPNGLLDVNMWLNKILFGYDYIRSSLSSADRNTLDTWFRNAGVFLEKNTHRFLRQRWPNRHNDDYTSSPWPLGNLRQILYFGGPGFHEWHASWDNQFASQTRTFGLIGILVNDATLKERAKRWVKEYIRFGVWYTNSHKIVTAGEYYRWGAFRTTNIGNGFGYSSSTLGAVMTLADVFARIGDRELYEYTSSEGYNGTQGGPKSFQLALTTHFKMMNHQIIRYASTTTTTDTNKIIDNIYEHTGWHSIGDVWIMPANLYFQNTFWKSIYLRSAPGTSPYPSSPATGGFNAWGGDQGIFPGVLFMFGQMEGKVSPYPGTTISTPLSTPPPPSSSSNPIGYWKFDEGTGTVAKDASGAGNHASLINGATWTTGKSGRAVFLDGLNDFVKIATTNFSTSQGTFTAWIKAPFFKSGTQYIFGHTSLPAYGNRIQLYTNDVAGNLDLGLGDSNTRALNIQQLQANTWHHVSLTWSSSTYAAYVDGVQKTKGTYSGLSTLNRYTHIGGVGLDTDPQPWSGAIDEVKVWNRALSPTEVQNEYNSYQASPLLPPSDLAVGSLQ